MFWLTLHFSIFCVCFLFPQAASLLLLFPLLRSFPFWWTPGPWEHFTSTAASHFDGSGLTHPGLRWIIALPCCTISLYLYFYKSLIPLHSDVLCFTANYPVWPALVRVTAGGEEVMWLGVLLGNSSAWSVILLDPHDLHIFSFVSDILSMRGIPPLRLFLRFLPSFYFNVKSFFFSIRQVFPHSNQVTEDVVRCTDCVAHWGNLIVILGYINKTDLIW